MPYLYPDEVDGGRTRYHIEATTHTILLHSMMDAPLSSDDVAEVRDVFIKVWQRANERHRVARTRQFIADHEARLGFWRECIIRWGRARGHKVGQRWLNINKRANTP